MDEQIKGSELPPIEEIAATDTVFVISTVGGVLTTTQATVDELTDYILAEVPEGQTAGVQAALDGAALPSAFNPFATIADIPPDELTADQLAAIAGAATPSALNVFATVADLPADELSADELAAVTGAASPSASNVFATMDDIPETTLPDLAGLLTTIPRRVEFVWGDSADGTEPTAENPVSPNATVQASIDALLALGYPSDNIVWLWREESAASTFTMANLVSGSYFEAMVITLAGGTLAMNDLVAGSHLEAMTITEEGALAFTVADLIAGSSLEAMAIVLAGGTLAMNDLVGGSYLEAMAISEAASGDIIYANASDADISLSGQISEGYTAVRSAATGGAVNAVGANILYVDAERYEEDEFEYFAISRAFIDFTIPSGSAYTSATLRLYAEAQQNTPVISIQEGTQAATVTTADFDAFTSAPNGTSLGQTSAISAVNQYYSISTAGLLSAINALRGAGGTLKLCIREYAHDFQNSAPVSGTYDVQFTSSAGTNKPMLELE